MQTKILVIIQDGKTEVHCTDKAAEISVVNYDRGDSMPANFFHPTKTNG